MSPCVAELKDIAKAATCFVSLYNALVTILPVRRHVLDGFWIMGFAMFYSAYCYICSCSVFSFGQCYFLKTPDRENVRHFSITSLYTFIFSIRTSVFVFFRFMFFAHSYYLAIKTNKETFDTVL